METKTTKGICDSIYLEFINKEDVDKKPKEIIAVHQAFLSK